MGNEKGPKIAFIMDSRISRERAGILSRIVHNLKRHFAIDLIQKNQLTEAEALQRVENGAYSLVLAPVPEYFDWNKIEGSFGMNRTSGPTFAGYLSEPLSFSKFPKPESRLRSIVLDFTHLELQEITMFVRTLTFDNQRSGLPPLLMPHAPIFYENWFGREENGKRIEHFLDFPEIKESIWNKRISSIRIIMGALWSIVFEEGPGKRGSRQSSISTEPIAAFQVGIDPHCLAFRLFFRSFPRMGPKEALGYFWPNPALPTKAPQLLVKYTDFIRVNVAIEQGEIEIVAGLLQSAPAEKFHEQARSIWIDACSSKRFTESPFEVDPVKYPRFKSLPDTIIQGAEIKGGHSQEKHQPEKTKKGTVSDASTRFEEARRKMASKAKESSIRSTSKSGSPDAESLLEAFQQHYFEARQQIRNLEIKIEKLEKQDAHSHDARTLRVKMNSLVNRQKNWIKRLVEMLEAYHKETQKKTGSDSS